MRNAVLSLLTAPYAAPFHNPPRGGSCGGHRTFFPFFRSGSPRVTCGTILIIIQGAGAGVDKAPVCPCSEASINRAPSHHP